MSLQYSLSERLLPNQWLCFIPSQPHRYGEIADIDMPRDKGTGKRRGFAFLMYEDQRSTVLAVDNLGGALVVGRTLRVDHVKDYKQKEKVEGKWVDRETERLNARPEMIRASNSTHGIRPECLNFANIDDDDNDDASDASSLPDINLDDPMRDFLIAQHKEKKAKEKKKKSKKHADETPEERKARKERKRLKKLAKERGRGEIEDHRSSRHRNEDLIGRRRVSTMSRSRSPPHKRLRTRSPSPRRDRTRERGRDPRDIQ